jgi:hypothetical protein
MVWTATPGGQYFYFRKTRSPLHRKKFKKVAVRFRRCKELKSKTEGGNTTTVKKDKNMIKRK